MDSRATQFEAVDVEKCVCVGTNLDVRNVHSLIARLDRNQPEGTRYDVQLKVVSEDSPSTNENIKEKFLGSLVVPNYRVDLDPARYVMEEDRPRASADEAMDFEHLRHAAGGSTNYMEGDRRWVERLSYYRGA